MGGLCECVAAAVSVDLFMCDCELPPAIIEIDYRFRSRLLAAVRAQRPMYKAYYMFRPFTFCPLPPSFRSPSKFARMQCIYRIFDIFLALACEVSFLI